MITEKYIAAIDLGTAKFALSVAKVKGDDVQVIYYREVPAVGMRNSNIAIPKKASDPLEKLIREWLAKPEAWQAMGHAAAQFAHPDATLAVVDLLVAQN